MHYDDCFEERTEESIAKKREERLAALAKHEESIKKAREAVKSFPAIQDFNSVYSEIAWRQKELRVMLRACPVDEVFIYKYDPLIGKHTPVWLSKEELAKIIGVDLTSVFDNVFGNIADIETLTLKKQYEKWNRKQTGEI